MNLRQLLKRAITWLIHIGHVIAFWHGLVFVVGILVAVGTFVWGSLEGVPKSLLVPAALFTFGSLVWCWNLISSKWHGANKRAIGQSVVGQNESLALFIIVFRGEARHQAPSGQDAHIAFHFWLFNGALQSFYVKDVRGVVRHSNAELGGNVSLKSGQEDIPRGARCELIIRQWISPESSRRIASMTRDDTRSEFSFDGVYVTIASRDAGFEGKEDRLQLPLLSNCGGQPWRIEWQ